MATCVNISCTDEMHIVYVHKFKSNNAFQMLTINKRLSHHWQNILQIKMTNNQDNDDNVVCANDKDKSQLKLKRKN